MTETKGTEVEEKQKQNHSWILPATRIPRKKTAIENQMQGIPEARVAR